MNMNYPKILITVMAAVFFSNMPVRAEENTQSDQYVHHLSGEISQIDVKLGTLQLVSNIPPSIGKLTEYRINKNETRVTDPLDQKFLTIDDLQAGQYVIVDVVNGEEDKVVKKIIAEPYLAPGLQQAFGDLEVIDSNVGTLILKQRPMGDNAGEGYLSYFVFEPKEIVVMQDPSIEPVRLVLKPGDLIRVIYVLKNEKKQAQSITLYSPKITQTVVTTTTTTNR